MLCAVRKYWHQKPPLTHVSISSQHVCVRINKYYFDCVSVHFVVFPKISMWKNINWRPDYSCSLERLCYGICLCLVTLTVRTPDDAAKQHSQAKNAKIATTRSKYSLSRKCEFVLSSLFPAYTMNKANACYVPAVAMIQQVRTVRLIVMKNILTRWHNNRWYH